MNSYGKKRSGGLAVAEAREGKKPLSRKAATDDARRETDAGGMRITVEEVNVPSGSLKAAGQKISRDRRNQNLLKPPAPEQILEEDSTSSISSSVRASRRNSSGSETKNIHLSREALAMRAGDESSFSDAKEESRRLSLDLKDDSVFEQFSSPRNLRNRRASEERRPSDAHSHQSHQGNPLQSTFIKVIARVRPRVERERDSEEGVEVLSDGSTIQLTDFRSNQRNFGVDEAIDSREEMGNTQEKFFSRAVQEFVTHSLKGYNICIFAYGHTGSGKTYTMLGDGARGDEHFGVLPRFIREVFAIHAQDPWQKVGHYCCEFAEVYNEQIRDLLAPMNSERARKIHVHPKHGVKVDGLHMSVVNSVEEALELVQFGNQVRTVATTTMNERSSRSHAIFTFKFQVEQEGTPNASDTASKNSAKAIYESTVTFVDLAGHEDQETSTNMNTTFREMTYINKSLLYLATVINKLAKGDYVRGSLADFRNSKLTLLLSQALIGNCRTALIATLAPLQAYYDDSVSTLNFASAVKKVQTKPVLNNKNQRMMVKELEEEVQQLRRELVQAKGSGADKEKELEAATMWADYYRRSWEDAIRTSQEMKATRKRFTKSLGLSLDDSDGVPRTETGEVMPFFTKLSDDPALQGCCNYFLHRGTSIVGNDSNECNIIVQGVGIRPKMCEVQYEDFEGNVFVKVIQEAENNEITGFAGNGEGVPRVLINGDSLEEGVSVRMSHGDSMILGYAHALRLVAPTREHMLIAESTETSALARTSIKNLTLAAAMGEIVEQRGNQFREVLPYLQQLGTRAPESVVQAFLQSLHKVCPLVDEANVITKDIWSRSGVFFRLQVLMDLFDLGNYKPEIVICVLQNMSPMARFKYAVHTVMHHLKQIRKGKHKEQGQPLQADELRSQEVQKEKAFGKVNSLAAWMNVQTFTHPVFSRQPSNETLDSASTNENSSPKTPPTDHGDADSPNGTCPTPRRSRRDTVQLMGEARHPMVHALGLEDHMSVGRGSKKEPLLYVWSLEKFLRRLKEMRELYQDASEDDQDNFKSLRVRMAAKPYLNPWREMTFSDVKMLAETQLDMGATSIAAHSRTVSKDKSMRSSPELQTKSLGSSEDVPAASSRSFMHQQVEEHERGRRSSQQPELVQLRSAHETKSLGSSEDVPAAVPAPKPTNRQLHIDDSMILGDSAEAAAGPSVAAPPPKAPKSGSREHSPNRNDAPDSVTAEMLKALAAAAAVPPPAGPAAAAAASEAAAATRAIEQPMKSNSEWQPVKAQHTYRASQDAGAQAYEALAIADSRIADAHVAAAKAAAAAKAKDGAPYSAELREAWSAEVKYRPEQAVAAWTTDQSRKEQRAIPARAVAGAVASHTSVESSSWNAASRPVSRAPSTAESAVKSLTAPSVADTSKNHGWSLAEAVRAYVAADPTPASSMPSNSQAASTTVRVSPEAPTTTPSLGTSPVLATGNLLRELSPVAQPAYPPQIEGPHTGSLIREVSAVAQPVQKAVVIPSTLANAAASGVVDDGDLTYENLEELRSELVACRMETGRMFTEQGRLASLLERFEKLIVNVTTGPPAYAALEHNGHAVLRAGSPAPSSPRLLAGRAIAAVSHHPAIMAPAAPSSPRMMSVGQRTPRIASPPRVASPSGSQVLQPRRGAVQEYIVGQRQYMLVQPNQGTSSRSGRSSPTMSPSRSSGVLRTVSPAPSPQLLSRTAAALFPALPMPGNASPMPGGSVSVRRTFSPRGIPTGAAPVLNVPTTAVPTTVAPATIVSRLDLPVASSTTSVAPIVSSGPILHSPQPSTPSPSHQGTPRAPLRMMHAASRSVSPSSVDGRASPPRVDLTVGPPSPRQPLAIERVDDRSASSSSFLQVTTADHRSDTPRLKGSSPGNVRSAFLSNSANGSSMLRAESPVANGGMSARSESVRDNEVSAGSSGPKSSTRSVPTTSARIRGSDRQNDRQKVERDRSEQSQLDRSTNGKMPADRPPVERAFRRNSARGMGRSGAELST